MNTRELYEMLAYGHSHNEEADEHTQESGHSHQDYVLDLLGIERFVELVLSTSLPAFVESRTSAKHVVVRNQLLSKHFPHINFYSQLELPEYKYSAYVELFFKCSLTLELHKEFFYNPIALTSKGGRQYSLYNKLINLIRTESNSPEFKHHIALRARRTLARQRSVEKYINTLLENHSRLLVLRIDFSYLFEFAKNITADKAKGDLSHFLSNKRGNPALFANLVGYIWKLEWGQKKGYHFHLIFFYNGRNVMKDTYWATQLGEYWKHQITAGIGNYHNCNASKHKYYRLGIGMLERSDDAKRKVLFNDVVGYLTKTDQYLMAAQLVKHRCIGKGELPQKKFKVA